METSTAFDIARNSPIKPDSGVPSHLEDTQLLLVCAQAKDELAPYFSTVFPDPDNIQLPLGISYYLVEDKYPINYEYYRLRQDSMGLDNYYVPLHNIRVVTPNFSIGLTGAVCNVTERVDQLDLHPDVLVNIIRNLLKRNYRVLAKRYLTQPEFDYCHSLGLVTGDKLGYRRIEHATL